jgi:hypothetical protein
MADLLQGIGEYRIALFHAKTISLRELKHSSRNHLSDAAPIRRPLMTAFVLPAKEWQYGFIAHGYRIFKKLPE